MINDIADVINISVSNPAESEYDIFVGLEHYDVGEPIITRYGSTKMLTTACKKFSVGDILLARRNVYLRRAGLVKFDGLTSGDSIVIRIKPNLSIEGVNSQEISRLLPFVLNTNAFWDFANTNSDGTMSKRLSPQMLLSYEFNLPPFSNQKPLADKLWAAYNLKASKLKLIDAIDEMVKSQFIEMLKGKAINGTISDLVAPKIANVKKTYSHDDTIKYIDISSINAKDHSVSQVTEYSVKNAPSRAQQCVKYGDLLVSTVRPINRNIAIVDKDLDNLVASTGFCVLRPNDGMLNYLLSIVLSDDFTNAMCDKANGGVYPAVNNGDVLNYQIHIPDDDLAKRASLVRQQADKSKFSGLKSQFIEMFGTLDNHPAEYAVKTLRDLSECYAGATPSTKVKEYWDNGSIPWMSSGEVHMEHVTETESKITESGYQQTSTKMVPVHSVVIALAGQGKTRGKVAITEIPLCTNQSLCAIVPSKDIHYF